MKQIYELSEVQAIPNGVEIEDVMEETILNTLNAIAKQTGMLLPLASSDVRVRAGEPGDAETREEMKRRNASLYLVEVTIRPTATGIPVTLETGAPLAPHPDLLDRLDRIERALGCRLGPPA